ncbi:MAG: HEAT repeat domain-containing protein, partial [Bryobacteraceae bacterium]
VPGKHSMCCHYAGNNVSYRGCSLEPKTSGRQGQNAQRPIQLEPPSESHVLFRVEQKQVVKIRMFSADCELDAGGRAVYWLTGVRPGESISLLSSFLRAREGASKESRRMPEAAMAAIALHADPGADTVLIERARNDQDPHTRGQALFWLSQRAGRKAASEIRNAIENDPDVKVKERAVFALSQLKDEGVPLLIEVARTNRSREVRKKAMFWLGQSKDPRALDFFEEVLTR